MGFKSTLLTLERVVKLTPAEGVHARKVKYDLRNCTKLTCSVSAVFKNRYTSVLFTVRLSLENASTEDVRIAIMSLNKVINEFEDSVQENT